MQTLKTLLTFSVLLLAVPALAQEPTIHLSEDVVITKSRLGHPSVEDEMSALAKEVPGFGGYFYAEDGRLTVYMKDLHHKAALHVLGQDVRVKKGDFDFGELREVRDALFKAGVMQEEGVVYLDLDEAANRVRIAVDEAQGGFDPGRLSALVAGLGLPQDAVVVSSSAAFVEMLRLTDTVRQVPGGFQIGSPVGICTLGFNFATGGATFFITNSHCTSIRGALDGTVFRQNASGGILGQEVVDAPLLNCGGTPCAFADCARAQYFNAAEAELGRLTRTINCAALPTKFGSLNVNGRLNITGARDPIAGEIVEKVGQTTGCTRGAVTATNVNVNVSGVIMLGQSIVSAGVAGGDSGSPVYARSGNNVTLLGLLHGGTVNNDLYVFSAFSDVINQC